MAYESGKWAVVMGRDGVCYECYACGHHSTETFNILKLVFESSITMESIRVNGILSKCEDVKWIYKQPIE